MLNDPTPLSRPAARRSGERGSALLAAVAVLVIGAFVVVAVMVATAASRQTAREQLDASSAEVLARDAGAVLAAAYSSLESGEHDGFAPVEQVLRRHADSIGAQTMRFADLGGGLEVVDSRVPARSRFAVYRDLGDGRVGFWQIFSIKLPDWNESDSGRVSVYVRVWTQTGTTADSSRTQPNVYRLEFRPQWMADFQMLVDGPVLIGGNARVNGRVHSNGYRTSFFDQYETLGAQIVAEAGTCFGSAPRITTSAGSISAPASCNPRADAGPRINLLRAREHARRLRAICAGSPARRPSVRMVCPATTAPINVRFSGSNVIVNGTSYSALVGGDRPNDNQGVVVISRGHVNLAPGVLTGNARAMVIASSDTTTTFTEGAGPSVRITQAGSYGSSAASTGASAGVVAEGDLLVDASTACGLNITGALLSMSGMLSIGTTHRVPIAVGGSEYCAGDFRFRGSVSGHYPPLMSQPINASGYGARYYEYLPQLFHNPPPMYPTAGDWELTKLAVANLDCFTATPALATTREDCA